MRNVFLGVAALGVLLVVGRQVYARMNRHHGRRPALREGGAVVLRPPRLLNIALGVTALPPAVILAIVAVRLAPRPEVGVGGLAVAGVLVVGGLLFSAWFFAAEFRQRVRVDHFGIDRVGVVRHRRVRWGDVARVTYNPVSRWFCIINAAGARLWISEDLDGIGDFATIALARLSPAALRDSEDAREVLQELASAAVPG